MKFKMSYIVQITRMAVLCFISEFLSFQSTSLKKHLLSATTAHLQTVLPKLLIYPQPPENEYVYMRFKYGELWWR
jgi:hypothetical protein